MVIYMGQVIVLLCCHVREDRQLGFAFVTRCVIENPATVAFFRNPRFTFFQSGQNSKPIRSIKPMNQSTKP